MTALATFVVFRGTEGRPEVITMCKSGAGESRARRIMSAVGYTVTDSTFRKYCNIALTNE